MKKALIYARVSGLTQKKDNTIGRQVEACRVYCKENGMVITHEYLDDGVCGSDKDRAFNLEAFVRQHRNDIDVVLFESVDRFSRDVMLCGYLQISIIKIGVEIISITQDSLFDETDPMKKAMNSMIKVFAQLEKDMLVHKMARGKKDRIEKGKRSSGMCPIGYRYEQESIGATRKKVVADETFGPLVKRIFKAYMETGSLGKLQKEVASWGATSPNGKAFSRPALSVILKNDFYMGNLTYNGKTTTGTHEALVSKNMFGRVQNAMKKNRRNTTA